MVQRRIVRQATDESIGLKTKINEYGYALTEENKYLHREVYKKAHGPIPKGWDVHHIDGNKSNNTLENLLAMPAPIHDALHAYMKDTGNWLGRSDTEAYVQDKMVQYDLNTKRLEAAKKERAALFKEIEILEASLTGKGRAKPFSNQRKKLTSNQRKKKKKQKRVHQWSTGMGCSGHRFS